MKKENVYIIISIIVFILVCALYLSKLKVINTFKDKCIVNGGTPIIQIGLKAMCIKDNKIIDLIK